MYSAVSSRSNNSHHNLQMDGGDESTHTHTHTHTHTLLLNSLSSVLDGHGPTQSSSNNNLDRGLYNDLVEIVPLVQSLIDRKASTSLTRRGSMIYTKTPSRDSRKNDAKKNAKSTLGKKNSDKELRKTNGSSDDCSDYAANMAAEKDREELNALREQLEELRVKLAEKDEQLKAAEMSKKEVVSANSQVDELKRYAAVKDSLVKSSQSQLNDAKIKLADRQAALEKLQWEAKTSNQQVEKLQEELESMQSEISAFMLLFESLSEDNPAEQTEDYDITPQFADGVPEMDNVDEMEEARKAYIAAVIVAKEKQDEGSLAAAARARLHLQSFVFDTITLEF